MKWALLVNKNRSFLGFEHPGEQHAANHSAELCDPAFASGQPGQVAVDAF
jgi:hypothetical protein